MISIMQDHTRLDLPLDLSAAGLGGLAREIAAQAFELTATVKVDVSKIFGDTAQILGGGADLGADPNAGEDLSVSADPSADLSAGVEIQTQIQASSADLSAGKDLSADPAATPAITAPGEQTSKILFLISLHLFLQKQSKTLVIEGASEQIKRVFSGLGIGICLA
ncbi:MAG: hypothetical protein ACTTIC_03335 [Helicobacteraceae bacterium]